MTERSSDEVRSAVREVYGKVAEKGGGGCAPGCCGPSRKDASLELGYSADDLASVPEGADMGLGCGNPQAGSMGGVAWPSGAAEAVDNGGA